VTAGTAPLLHTSAPGVVLARSTHTEASPTGIGAVATALGILQGVFTPLSVQVDLDRIDELGLPTGDLDDPIRSLHAPRPPGLRPVDLAGAHATAVSAIVPATLAEWLRAACFEPDVGWVHLRTTAAKAYTADTPPSTLRNLEGKPFATVQGTDDDGSFVAGPVPGSSADPPLAVEANHEGFRLELHLRVVWPLWSAPSSPGQRILADRIQQLVDAGWSLEHASGAFAALRRA
jgi:hypothetical protein